MLGIWWVSFFSFWEMICLMGIWAVDNGLLLIGNGLELGNYGSMDGCGNLGYMYVCMYGLGGSMAPCLMVTSLDFIHSDGLCMYGWDWFLLWYLENGMG